MQQKVKSIEAARQMNMEQKDEYPQVMVSTGFNQSKGDEEILDEFWIFWGRLRV